MRLKPGVALTILAALPVLLATGCTTKDAPKADATPLTIGVDLELSGPGAGIASTYQRALQLTVARINTSGQLNRPVRLVTVDNHSDPKIAAADVTKFADDPTVAAVIMGSCSSCAVAAAPVANDRKIPLLSLAPAVEVSSPVAERQYVFKVAPNPVDTATLLIDELRQSGRNKVALLTTDDVNGSGVVQALKEQTATASITVTAYQFQATDMVFAQQVNAALDNKPDAVIVSAFPAQAGAVSRTLRVSGYRGPLLLDAPAAGGLYLPSRDAASAEGSVMIAPESLVVGDVVANTPAKLVRKSWFDLYTSTFGSFSTYSTYPADAVHILTRAVQATGGVDREKLRAVVEDTQFDGLSGPIQITPDNHSALMPQALVVAVARNGRWWLLG